MFAWLNSLFHPAPYAPAVFPFRENEIKQEKTAAQKQAEAIAILFAQRPRPWRTWKGCQK